MVRLSMVLLAAGAAPLAAQSTFPAPDGARILSRDQAIGCQRGYSIATATGLAPVTAHYARVAQAAGLQPSSRQDQPGFRVLGYSRTDGARLLVAVNARTRPTTAAILYRPAGARC